MFTVLAAVSVPTVIGGVVVLGLPKNLNSRDSVPALTVSDPVPEIVVGLAMVRRPLLLTTHPPGLLIVSLLVKETPTLLPIVSVPVSVVGRPLPVTCAEEPL